MSELPKPPRIAIEIHDDHTARSKCDEGFLRLRRLELRNRYTDGEQSKTYRYDLIERDAIDAVVVLIEGKGDREPTVLLRSALRPPLAFRDALSPPVEGDDGAVLWELPAGLIEEDERGEDGIKRCGARETHEETGYQLSVEDFSMFGPPVYLTPGVIAEKIHFVHVHVGDAKPGVPPEDGSPVEERAEIRFVPLSDAIAAIDAGRIVDAKTEIAIRRLAMRSAHG